jgi:DNA-binding CsgD family transcriptional regulator
VQAFYERAVEERLEVWDMYSADRILGGDGKGFNNAYANEVLFPQQMADTNSLFVPSARGTAHLALHTFRRTPEPGEHLPVLQVLLPAFKAGLDAVARFSAQRSAFDAVAEPLAAYDADGREVFRNAALTRLLAADPERERVEGTLRLLAGGLRALAFAPAGHPVPVAREVRTARGRYTLRGLLIGPDGWDGRDTFLVTVEPPAERSLPSAEEVRQRHGLTKREAEVALLLVEGLTNDAVAARLFVSTHTARHHVEAVLGKLGVPNRAAVATRLLQPL